MNIDPPMPSKPPAQRSSSRRSIGPAVNALTIVGFVVMIALAGHRFSSSTAPVAPSIRAQSAPALPPAVLHALRSGAGGVPHSFAAGSAAPSPHQVQIALQPTPVVRPHVGRAQPVEVVCTAAMSGASREACLTARLRWADRRWRADYRQASEAKPAQPQLRS